MCVSPITLTRKVAGRMYSQTVPCGKCVECKRAQQNEYVFKCVESAKQYGNVWFITLTYNNDNVPITFDEDGEIDESTGEFMDEILTLRREDIKLWKKRVKKAYEKKYGKRLDLHYLIAGEYGPKTHRPHYHCMFFGLSKEAAHMLEVDWNKHYGFTYFKYIPSLPVNGVDNVERTSRYCSKYCIKLEELEDENVKSGKVEKPRKMTSKGLGINLKQFSNMKRYYLAQDMYDYNPDTLHKDLNKEQVRQIVNEVKKRRKLNPIPAYFRKKIYYNYNPDTYEYTATELQKMVSLALQCDIQKDYSRQLAALATNQHLPEDMDGYYVAQKDLESRLHTQREASKQVIIETNLSYLRRSKQ